MPKKEPHVHEYIRVTKLDGSPDKNRYRCADPDCHHWMYKNFLKGKRTICTNCHVEEFFLDRESLRRAKPTCFKCSNTVEARSLRNRLTDLEDLFKTPDLPGAISSAAEIDTGNGVFLNSEPQQKTGAAPSAFPDWTREEKK